MVKHEYGGEFTSKQIEYEITLMRKRIYFLILIVDPKTKNEYANMDVDVNKSFDSVLRKMAGLNELFMNRGELVDAMASLKAALIEYNKPDFNWNDGVYRRLVLDAGNYVLKMKEV